MSAIVDAEIFKSDFLSPEAYFGWTAYTFSIYLSLGA
jgi:hypothetical protein